VRPYLTLDLDEPLAPNVQTALDVPLWPTLWSIEREHSIVVRIATQPVGLDCGALLALPIGCNLTNRCFDDWSSREPTAHRLVASRTASALILLSGSLATPKTEV